jgi:hypothetical protein
VLLSFLKDLMPRFGRSRRESSHATLREKSAIRKLTYRRGGAVLAFVPTSEGDALKQHTLEMLQPIRSFCEEIVLLDLNDPTWFQKYEAAARNPIWFAMSPFGGGEYHVVEGEEARSPWAEAGIPFVRLFGDVPAYFPAKHVQHFANSINAYGHSEHDDFFVRWFAQKAPSLTLPLFPFDTIPKHSVDLDGKAASGTIIFPKNGNCPDRLVQYWRASLPPAVVKALESVAEGACAALDQPIDLFADLQRYFAGLGINLPENQRLMFFLFAQLDDYLRRKKSTLIARSLLGHPVVIRGVNWEHIDFFGKRARHDPDSDYGRTRRLLDESMAIIDMSPNTHRGAHDRVLRAAGRYTAFLTNRQQFYIGNFPSHRSFTFLFNPDVIRECIDAALSRPRETVEMGVAQAERMRELLTEEKYVEQLVTAVDACVLGCEERPPGTQNYVSYQPICVESSLKKFTLPLA